MEDNIFILSDASFSDKTKLAGLGVIDTFTQKKYQLSVNKLNSVLEAEFYALALSIKIAIRNNYSNVIFVYDCKYLNITALVEYANKKIKNAQFLWLKRYYLSDVDSLAKNARKLIEKLNIKKATNSELVKIKKDYMIKNKQDFFKSFSTKKKILAVMNICNTREKEILNGFLSSSSISFFKNKPLGSNKGRLLKFVYLMLKGEDKISFLHYLTYVNPNLNKKSFVKSLNLMSINNYIDRVFVSLKKDS